MIKYSDKIDSILFNSVEGWICYGRLTFNIVKLLHFCIGSIVLYWPETLLLILALHNSRKKAFGRTYNYAFREKLISEEKYFWRKPTSSICSSICPKCRPVIPLSLNNSAYLYRFSAAIQSITFCVVHSSNTCKINTQLKAMYIQIGIKNIVFQ